MKDLVKELVYEVIGRIMVALAFAGLCVHSTVGTLDWPAIYALACLYFVYRAFTAIQELGRALNAFR